MWHFSLSNGGIMYVVSITIDNDNIDVKQNMMDKLVKLSFSISIYLSASVFDEPVVRFIFGNSHWKFNVVLMNSRDY